MEEIETKGYAHYRNGEVENIIECDVLYSNPLSECINFVTEYGKNYLLYRIVEYKHEYKEVCEREQYFKFTTSPSGRLQGYTPTFEIKKVDLF